MVFKKAQKITAADLDQAAKEYEMLLKQTEKTYATWDNQKDMSCNSISKVEQLASSISNTTYTIGTKVKKLTVHKEGYKSRETIQLLVGLLAVLGNDLSLQAFVSFSSYFLVDNFISHLRLLLFESAFSNSIAHQNTK